MPTESQNIDAALIAQAKTAAGFPSTVYTRDRQGTPPKGSNWAEIKNVYGSRRPRTVAADKNLRTGTLMVVLCSPLSSGEGAPKALADAICDVFRPGQDILIVNGVRIHIRSAEPESPYPDGEWIRCPVAVSWWVL